MIFTNPSFCIFFILHFFFFCKVALIGFQDKFFSIKEMWKRCWCRNKYMQPECRTAVLNICKTSSLEGFYLEAVIPLISITLKSSFCEGAQVSDSYPCMSSFSHGFVKASWLKLRHNYKTFGGYSKILWYFYFTVQKNRRKMRSLREWMSMASTSCYTSILRIQYSFGIGSDEINFKKVCLSRESHILYMSLPVSELRAQTVVQSSI